MAIDNKLDAIAHQIRYEIIKMLVPLESHHIGCSLGIVEILTALYFEVMNIDPKNPEDINRDYFILSKGHAGASLYATLALRGFFDKKLLSQYDTNGGLLPEHASRVVSGVELSTGSLGHGLPVGLGLALSAKRDKRPNKVFVLMSDGELDEGSNWEAFLFASQHKLNNVIAIIDKNGLQGFGKTEEVISVEPIKEKLESFGWAVQEADGHDLQSLKKAMTEAQNSQSDKPNIIIAKTIKGRGIPFFEGKFESHYYSISEEKKAELLSSFNKKS